MEEIKISAVKRDVVGKQVKALRREGLLPAIIYGHGVDPVKVSLKAHDMSLALPKISSSQLVVLDVEGENHTTLIRERQRDPVSGSFIHIDFLEVSMTEKLRTNVRLAFIGEAPAVDEFGGLIMTNTEALEIECMPGNLPSSIEVDISVLKHIGDSIFVKDIEIPQGVEVLTDPEELLILVTAPAMEEEEEVEVVEMGDAEPEVIERGRRDEEEEEE